MTISSSRVETGSFTKQQVPFAFTSAIISTFPASMITSTLAEGTVGYRHDKASRRTRGAQGILFAALGYNRAQHTDNNLGRLVKVMDGQGEVATDNYTVVGTLLSITRSTGGVGAPTTVTTVTEA